MTAILYHVLAPAGGHPTREGNFIEKILKCKVPFSKPHQETKSTKAVRCCFKKCSKSILYIIINRISFPYNKIIDYWGIVDLRVPILTEADHIMSNASIVNNCFFYIISLNKKETTTKSWPWTMSWTVLNCNFM